MTNRERAEQLGDLVADCLCEEGLRDHVNCAGAAHHIERVLDEAEKRGAEKMRERAAQAAVDFPLTYMSYDSAVKEYLADLKKRMGEKIRALPVEE